MSVFKDEQYDNNGKRLFHDKYYKIYIYYMYNEVFNYVKIVIYIYMYIIMVNI